MPRISSDNIENMRKIARVFGLEQPGGRSTWKSFSPQSARQSHSELAQSIRAMTHKENEGGECRCAIVAFTLLAANHLPEFLHLYLSFATNESTHLPFTITLIFCAAEPYLGAYLRQNHDYRLLDHQVELLLAFEYQKALPPTRFNSSTEVENWGHEVYTLYRLILLFRIFVFHFSKGLNVPNPLRPSISTATLLDRLERLILPPLAHQLSTPFDLSDILGPDPSQAARTQTLTFTETAQRDLDDAVFHIRALVDILRLGDAYDNREPFKHSTRDKDVHRSPEDCCRARRYPDSVCVASEGELKVCSRCRAVVYCSEEHQLKDWPTHKRICVAVSWGIPVD